MSNNEFKTDFTADGTQLDAAFEAAAEKAMTTGQAIQSSMREAAQQLQSAMQSSLAKVGESLHETDSLFSKLRETVLEVAGAAGVGLTFKGLAEFTTSAIEGEAALKRLSQQTTLSVELLSRLQAVATLGGHSISDVAGAASKFAKSAAEAYSGNRELAQTFQAMGIALVDQTGKLRPLDQLYVEFAQKIAGAENPTLALGYAVRLAGRAAAEQLPFFHDLAEQGLEHTRVTTAQAEAAERFEKNMNGLKVTMNDFRTSVANNMLPALTAIAKSMKEAMQATNSFWAAMAAGARTALTGDDEYKNDKDLVELTEQKLALMNQIDSYSDPSKAYRGIPLDKLRAQLNAVELQIDATMRYRAALAKTAEEEKKETPQDGKLPPLPKAHSEAKSEMPELETKLAAQRDAYERAKLDQGSFEQYSLGMERDYWKQILDAGGLSRKDAEAVSRKYYDAERGLRKQSFDAEMADYKARSDAAQKGSVERILIAGEEAAKIGDKFGQESKEYRAALAEMSRMARERVEEQRKLDELQTQAEAQYQSSRIALERQSLDSLEALGQINATQKLQRLKALQEQEFAIELKGAQDRAALLKQDPVAYQAAMNKIEQLKQKQQLDMKKIDTQITAEGIKPWKTIGDAMTSSMESAFKGLIQGTETWRQALQGIAQSVLMTMLDVAEKILADKATKLILAKLMNKEEAGAAITDNSAAAATAAFASTAAIPIVGLELAPAAASAAFAGSMAWASSLISAAGGFSIPSGMNPVAQLHQEEMVLPADIANPLRSKLSGAGGRGLGGDTHFHFDMGGIIGDKEQVGRHIMKMIKGQQRNFFRG